MTDKEIEALAREYVADVYNGDTDFKPEAECLINWLSERYEIVAKEKIKKERETAEWTGNNGGLYGLKMLFPQNLKQE